MEDRQIVQLYWDRDQQAIACCKEKYGIYCFSVANHILESREDFGGMRQRHLVFRMEQDTASPAQRLADVSGKDHPRPGL